MYLCEGHKEMERERESETLQINMIGTESINIREYINMKLNY